MDKARRGDAVYLREHLLEVGVLVFEAPDLDL
jgi:hypothetical protein